MDRKESQVQEVFGQARKGSLSCPPYLETRVLAVLRERQRRSRSLSFWKGVALTCAVLSVAIVTRGVVSVGSGSLYQARVHEAMLVSVEVQPLESARIAYAEIDLPSGVAFYSRNHPDLGGQRNLEIAWEPRRERIARFPFAIRSNESGVRTVYVRFRDADHNLVSEKALRIRFAERASG